MFLYALHGCVLVSLFTPISRYTCDCICPAISEKRDGHNYTVMTLFNLFFHHIYIVNIMMPVFYTVNTAGKI